MLSLERVRHLVLRASGHYEERVEHVARLQNDRGRAQMADLRTRINDEIERELDRLSSGGGSLEGAKDLRLVPFVGNGLSRFALRHSRGTDLSYDQIVEAIASDAGLAPLEHLKARGYAVDEVFREAAGRLSHDAERIRSVFRDLWNTFSGVQPSPLHSQIARLGRAFITTNYDLLLEQALFRSGRYLPGRWPHPRMTRHSGAAYPFPAPGDYAWESPPLYKIHGSFPDLHGDGRLPDPGEINRWLRGGDGEHDVPHRDLLVVDSGTYDYWSWYCAEEEFVAKFQGPFSVLHDAANLVVPLGHGLSAEERILFRLRELARRKDHAESQLSARGVIPLFETEMDEPTVRLPYGVVRVHPALAGSPRKRELALILLLKALVRRGIIAVRGEPEIALPTELEEAARLEPRTIMMGQLALHTNRGYEDAPAQERAYSPQQASWAPGRARQLPLESREPFGDALVPALLWDAIELPCALEGRVGCDHAGRRVYSHLIWHTTTVDFRPVQQDRDATEQATVASWFDLRLILDGPRRGAGGIAAGSRDLSTKTPLDARSASAEMAVPARPGRGRYLYVTKPGWPVVRGIATPDDVVVFDTGNNCNAAVIAEVLSTRSIVIASALSFWMLLRVVREHAPHRPLSGSPADYAGLGEVWRSLMTHQRPAEEPKDETGRYEQFVGLLGALQNVNYALAGSSIEPLLELPISVAVSLGPLGVLWWSSADWSKAWWTRVEDPEVPKTMEATLTGQPLPFSEIRCGLGCGDSGRAGFAAGLELTPGLEPAALGCHRERLPLTLTSVYEAMAWWGASRLMFWSISGSAADRQDGEDAPGGSVGSLCQWLARNRTEIRRQLALEASRRTYIWPDGSRSRKLITSRVTKMEKATLSSFKELWDREIVTPRRPEGRGGWVQAVQLWRTTRGMTE